MSVQDLQQKVQEVDKGGLRRRPLGGIYLEEAPCQIHPLLQVKSALPPHRQNLKRSTHNEEVFFVELPLLQTALSCLPFQCSHTCLLLSLHPCTTAKYSKF